MKEKRTIRLIRKSNDLVEGRYRFDIWEMRIFTKMLTMIKHDDQDFKEYRIYLKDVVKEFQLDNKNAYALLKEGAIRLTKKEIRIVRSTEEGDKEFVTNIAVGVDSFLNNGNYLDISFHPKMKPFLLQLQSQFLMYDIRNVLSIQSSFSVRMYELLKQYETIGKRLFQVQELKDVLDISDKYRLYGHFKERVILKAQEDLEKHTDIRFTFEEIKKGKAVVQLVFYIHPNTKVFDSRQAQASDDTTTFDVQAMSSNVAALYDLVKGYPHASINTVKDWLAKYTPEYIRQRIQFVENFARTGKEIRNPIGLIQTLLLQPDLFAQEEEQKKQQLQKTAATKRQKEQAKQQSTEDEQRRIAQANDIKDKIQKALLALPDLTNTLLEELQQSRVQENPSFMIELAYDNYQTDLAGIPRKSIAEVLYNYEQGGSFAAYLIEWLSNRKLL